MLGTIPEIEYSGDELQQIIFYLLIRVYIYIGFRTDSIPRNQVVV